MSAVPESAGAPSTGIAAVRVLEDAGLVAVPVQ